MKTPLIFIPFVLGAALWAGASEYSMVWQDGNQKLLSRIEETLWADGVRTQDPHYLMVLETGMNHLENNVWVPSQEIFEPVQGGAAAIHGQHKAFIAENLNTFGSITLETPTGARIRMHVLCLALTDRASGRSVRIADVQDCQGFIVRNNRLVFKDAFNGGVSADVVFVYTKFGFEQDIHITGALPHAPEDYKMNRATTCLEVFTEVIEIPPAEVSEQMVAQETDPVKRLAMIAPDMVDQTIDVALLRFTHGRAFTTGLQGENDHIVAAKTYETRDNRRFIIERVRYSDIQPALAQLPAAVAPAPVDGAKVSKPDPRLKRLAYELPAPPPARGKKMERITRMASLPIPEKALVLDYTTINTSHSNYVFQADTCYYLPGTVILTGTNNQMEGGTIIKYDRGAMLRVDGNIHTVSNLYHPCVLTASADSTVGEAVSGTLSGTYASPALLFNYATTNVASLQNLRILYATIGVQFEGGSGHELRHVQFGNCGTAIKADGANFAVRNVLGWNLTNAMSGTVNGGGNNPTSICEHATFNQVKNLVGTNGGGNATVVVNLTNSLLVGINNTNGFTGLSNAVVTSSNGVFKVVGGGQHYLADNSIYRGAGTTNINANLLAELPLRTTYAPTPLTNLTGTVVLTPTATRMGTVPDLGFAYPPLDYWASAVVLDTNSLIIATNGVAVGVDVSTNGYGLEFKAGARLISEGLATSLNRFVRAHCAQEKSGGHPATRAFFYDGLSTSVSCELRLRFTELAQLQNDGYQLYVGSKFSAIEWLHSQVYNLSWVDNLNNSAAQIFGLTNTILERGCFTFWYPASGGAIHARNNLFRNLHEMDFNQGSSNVLMTNSSFMDNLFDTLPYFADGRNPLVVSNNAYYQFSFWNTGSGNDPNRWTNSPNKVLTSLSYLTGPLGNYYLPTNSTLINAGSRTADAAMLFHFCSTTNQVKETNSVVDIGAHFVAVDAAGKPLDYDGDGLYDYVEDRNRNGQLDPSLFETDWQTYTTVRTNLPQLQVFTPLR